MDSPSEMRGFLLSLFFYSVYRHPCGFTPRVGGDGDPSRFPSSSGLTRGSRLHYIPFFINKDSVFPPGSRIAFSPARAMEKLVRDDEVRFSFLIFGYTLIMQPLASLLIDPRSTDGLQLSGLLFPAGSSITPKTAVIYLH